MDTRFCVHYFLPPWLLSNNTKKQVQQHRQNSSINPSLGRLYSYCYSLNLLFNRGCLFCIFAHSSKKMNRTKKRAEDIKILKKNFRKEWDYHKWDALSPADPCLTGAVRSPPAPCCLPSRTDSMLFDFIKWDVWAWPWRAGLSPI